MGGKGSGSVLSTIEEQRIKFLSDCGKSLTDIASSIGRGRSCVRGALKRLGVNRPTKSFSERFWEKVDIPHGGFGCWRWSGAIMSTGYGMLFDGRAPQLSHRVAWEMVNGTIADSAMVLHFCDNKRCVNPSHLRLGNHRDNAQDAVERGQHVVGERHPFAKLTAESVLRIRTMTSCGISHGRIAIEMGVSRATVSDVVKRRTWKHT